MNFIAFFSTDSSSTSNFAFYNTHIEFWAKILFGFYIKELFANLKAKRGRNGTKNEIIINCLRIPFYINFRSRILQKKVKIVVPCCTVACTFVEILTTWKHCMAFFTLVHHIVHIFRDKHPWLKPTGFLVKAIIFVELNIT